MQNNKEKPNSKETPEELTEPLSEVNAEVRKTIQNEAGNAIGEGLNYEELASNPNKLDDVIIKLTAAWERLGKNFDELFALFAPLGLKPSEIDRPEFKPAAYLDEKESKPVEKKNEECAKHAQNALKENPAWNEYIKTSSAAYGIPESTVAAFIEMESGYNPTVKNPESSALGLSQALKTTFEAYVKAGHPNAKRENPKDAIDFVAWYCKNLIETVNESIERKNLPYEFQLTYTDARNLYLAYHEGPNGYLALRTYQKNSTPENFERLKWWQKRYSEVGGEKVFSHEFSSDYANRVAEVATAYEKLSAAEATA